VHGFHDMDAKTRDIEISPQLFLVIKQKSLGVRRAVLKLIYLYIHI
jgi:hypothetical protein